MMRTSARVLVYTVIGVAPLFLVSVGFVFLQEIYPLRRDHLGLGVSTYFVVAALTALVLRRHIDGVGPERGLRASAVLTAVATASAAFVIRGPATLVVVLACAGASNALAQISANVAVATRVSQRRQALGFGIKQSAIPVASLLVSVTTPWIAGVAGWQVPFLVTAAVAGVAAVAGPRLVVSRRAAAGRGGQAGTPGQPGPPPQALPRPARARGARRSRSMSPARVLGLLALANGLGSSAGNATAVFAVDAGLTVAGVSVTSAALLLGVASAASVVVRVGAGWLVDRAGGDPVPVLRVLLAGGVVSLVTLAVAGTQPLVFAVALVVALGAGWGFPGLTHYASTRLTDLPPGASSGPVVVAGYLGPVIAPAVVGVVAEAFSYQVAWAMLAVLALVATVSVTLLPTGLQAASPTAGQR